MGNSYQEVDNQPKINVDNVCKPVDNLRGFDASVKILRELVQLVFAEEGACSVSLHDMEIMGTRRNRAAFGLLDQVLDMASAVRILIGQNNSARFSGTAGIIVRSMLEMYVRALWAMHIASDEQIDRLVDKKRDDGRWPLSHAEMTAQVEAKLDHDGLLSSWTRSYWKSLCGYTHGSVQAFGRRSNVGFLEPHVSELELVEILSFASLLGQFACHACLLEGGRKKESLDRKRRIAASAQAMAQARQALASKPKSSPD